MAILMRGVKRTQPGLARLSAPRYNPVADVAPMGQGEASPPAVATMPVHEVRVYPSPSAAGYSTIAYRGMTPIWATGGEPILATAPGRWAQLRAAGRP